MVLSWVKRWLHGKSKSGTRGSRPSRRPETYRHQLEVLERRIVPVTINNGLATSTVGYFTTGVLSGTPLNPTGAPHRHHRQQ